jgi:hypothetical protein
MGTIVDLPTATRRAIDETVQESALECELTLREVLELAEYVCKAQNVGALADLRAQLAAKLAAYENASDRYLHASLARLRARRETR